MASPRVPKIPFCGVTPTGMLLIRRAELEAGRGRMMLVGFANTRGLSDPPPWPLTQMLHDPWHSAIADAAGVG